MEFCVSGVRRFRGEDVNTRMDESKQRAVISGSTCEVRFDDVARQLYATDASLYQITPVGVAFPRSDEEARSVVRAAVEADVPIIPRGAGTGLAGGAIGRGLVIDFSKYNRVISNFDPERRTVRGARGSFLTNSMTFSNQEV